MKSQRLFRNIIWQKILSTFNFRLFTQSHGIILGRMLFVPTTKLFDNHNFPIEIFPNFQIHSHFLRVSEILMIFQPFSVL